MKAGLSRNLEYKMGFMKIMIYLICEDVEVIEYGEFRA